MTCLEIIEILERQVPYEDVVIINTIGNVTGIEKIGPNLWEFITD